MRTSQVFVSHTSDMALFPHRRSFVNAAHDGVSRAGLAAVDMRYFAARAWAPAEYCQLKVRDCEIYLVVVGFQYGSIVPDMDVSFTEMEFDEASAAGLPRLAFLLSEGFELPNTLADADRAAVDRFRQKLRDAGLLVREFASPADLELEVFHALCELPGSLRPGSPGTVSSGSAVAYSLPPDTTGFIGRDDEVDAITGALAGDESASFVLVHAFDGMPGVGKTALAVHVAHLLQHRYPDRQLFTDLHAHTPGHRPVAPATALAGLLMAVGVSTADLPGDLAGRADLWRERMAGQRAVLILDNAASSEQVVPLLPGAAGCLVLVTSRRHLGDLPGMVASVPLDALARGEATEMFLQMVPPSGLADPAAVGDLVGLAGFLPLAISLLARVYARHSAWTLADLIRETKASLLTIAAEKDTVAAAFDVSYQYLSHGQKRFFRQLGLHPGTTVDPYSAAALAGISVREAERHLDELHHEGLITEVRYRRYAMHDLIRRYARHRVAAFPAARSRRALERLLDYYQHTAALAEAILARQTQVGSARPGPDAGPMTAPELTDRAHALSWARAERANLLACLDLVTRRGQLARVVALTAAMAAFMRHDGPWTEAIGRHAAASEAAERLGDIAGQANALFNLATVRYLTADYPGATEALRGALRRYRLTRDRVGEANALASLGTVRYLTGDYPGATEALQGALRRYRLSRDQLGEANTLTSLGTMRRLTGEYPGAIDALNKGLSIYRRLGDEVGLANALGNLGAVLHLTGDFPPALAVQEEALVLSRGLGDLLSQANTLDFLGIVRRLTGDYPGALAALEEALGIARRIGNRLSQAHTLSYLGIVRRLTGDFPGAAEALQASLDISTELGNRLSQANALSNLAALQLETGNLDNAANGLASALAIYRGIGDKGGEAEALNTAGALHRALGEVGSAQSCHQQALHLAEEIVSPWDKAHALAGLARCALAIGDVLQAQTMLRQASEIFHQLGAAEATAIADELAELARIAPDGDVRD